MIDQKEYRNLLLKIIDLEEADILKLGPSLFHGATLYIYLYFSLANKHKDENLKGKAFSLLDQVLHNISKGKFMGYGVHSLSLGYTGIGLALWHLHHKNYIKINFDDDFSLLDDFLFSLAQSDIKKGYIDYLHGSFGVLHYFSRRQDNDIVKKYTDILLENFYQACKKDSMGLRVKNLIISDAHENSFDMGIAHGLSGILIILNNLYYKGGNSSDIILDIIERGINYIDSTYRPCVKFRKGLNSFYPTTVDENYSLEDTINTGSYISRLGWCYGDLNQVILRLQLGDTLKRRDLYDHALRLSEDIIQLRANKNFQVIGTGICHGSAGLSLIFRWLYEKTNIALYLSESEYWSNTTKEYIANYEYGEAPKFNSSLLEGIPGVVLSYEDSSCGSLLRDIMLLN